MQFGCEGFMAFILRSLFFSLNFYLCLFISSLFASQVVWANDRKIDSNLQQAAQLVVTDERVDRVGDLLQVHTTIKTLLAQAVNSAKITGVKIKSTIFYRRDNWRAAINFQNIFNADYSNSPFQTRELIWRTTYRNWFSIS
jgi:outer membrane receptor protein involved in Fe transport